MIEQMKQLGLDARAAAKVLAGATTAKKNAALLAMAKAIRAPPKEILAANAQELDAPQSQDLKSSFVDCLTLNPARLKHMAQA